LSLSRLDPLIEGFVRDVFSLKVVRRINLQSSCNDIRTLSSFELTHHVLSKGVIQIEFSFSISSFFSCSIRLLLSSHG
jgi:hypothetical protein